MGLIYKAGIEYDNYRNAYATASAEFLVTSSAATNSEGLWTPGYGTGDDGQLYIQALSATAPAEIILYKINVIAEDTGGL
jgi:hypothetical protein